MSSDKLRIDTGRLDDISQQFSRLGGSLNTIGSSISEAISTARAVVPEQSSIIRNLTKLNSRVTASGNYARKLSGAVRNASARWAEAEAKTSGAMLEKGEDGGSYNGGAGSEESSGDPAWKQLVEGLGKLVGGGTLATGLITTAWSAGLGDLLRDIALKVGDKGSAILAGMKGTNVEWAGDILGKLFEPYSKTFGEALTSPLSIAYNMIKSGVENWELAENGNVPRFVTETLSEAGTNLLMSAGAATLIAAAIPGAPVIAVTALGTLAVWGVNSLVEWATGKDVAGWVGEGVGWLTDRAVDGGKWLIQKGGEAVDWVTDKGSQLLQTGAQVLTDAASTACNFFGSIFA